MTESKIEALKLLQDRSKWLVAIETAACAALWPKLTVDGKPAPDILYWGWFLFCVSILAGTALLLVYPLLLYRMDPNRQQSYRLLTTFLVIEYSFFLAGVLCFATRILQMWHQSG
jgi:hypothetical protein